MVSQSRNFFGTFYVLFVCLFCFCISNQLSPEEETPKIRYLYHIIFSNTLLYRTHFKILNNIISLKRLFIPKANFHLTVENHDITFKQNGTKKNSHVSVFNTVPKHIGKRDPYGVELIRFLCELHIYYKVSTSVISCGSAASCCLQM